MVYPAPRIVEEGEAAIVDSAKVMIGICGRYQLTQLVPILLRMENVKFIRHSPPDISKCPKSRDDIAKIRLIMLRTHFCEAPLVIRMEQNNVGFYVQRLKVSQSCFIVREEL